MAPGFLLNLSRIDKCTMRKDVEAVLWSSNPISLAQTNALLEILYIFAWKLQTEINQEAVL
jgi:hypothetical protein